MLLRTRSILLTATLLLLLLLLLAPEAEAGRRRRLKRQHNADGGGEGPQQRQHRRRDHWRRRGRREGLRHAARSAPVRHTEAVTEGIPVGEAAPPPQCPPPILPVSSDLCGVRACFNHRQCPEERACCFNGCLHTCLIKVDSPPVIDWLVDTSALLPILDEPTSPELPVRYEDLSFAEGREEAVHLPGGCTISGTQYSQLQNFMKAPSIENCKCDQGEVVCAVKMFHS